MGPNSSSVPRSHPAFTRNHHPLSFSMAGFTYHKPGLGSWSTFEDGLSEYKEAQLKADWWYHITPATPYSTRAEKKRFNQTQTTKTKDQTTKLCSGPNQIRELLYRK